jgi:hypothetical protein
MTIPAIEPPLRLLLLSVVLPEVSSPEVETGAATVTVLTWPPASVVSLTTLLVVEASVVLACRKLVCEISRIEVCTLVIHL